MTKRRGGGAASKVAPGILAGLVLAVAPRLARAADCDTLPAPVVYGIGGSANKPIIGKVAAALSGTATIVYQAPGACVGVNAVINGTKLAAGSNASYWTAAGVETQCTIPTGGVTPTYSFSGNSATLCPGVSALPATVGDFPGPVSSVNFVVPLASSQQSISAEAAHFVYGYGATGQASPWTDEAEIIKRNETSFVALFVQLATGVPATAFKGVDAMSNGNTVTLVANAPNPEKAIGFCSGDVADANRSKVRTLAYQHLGQSCGYWPDSTATAFDKINVREGQYYLWSGIHILAPIDANTKVITDAPTRDFVGLFTGASTPPAGVDILALTVASGQVPLCAMHVARTTDLGPLMSVQPDEPCGCAFDKLATGVTTCTACTDDAGCPSTAPKCRHSYCEVK